MSEIVALADYRLRYAAYRADPDLQRLHQLFPMILMWDDHEAANDAWKNGAENHQPETEGTWDARKIAAKRAYREWLPVSDDDWARTYAVNVDAHVYAARRLVPEWLERGSGCFVTTASAAGLLGQIGSAPYTVTKHAAVAFAEYLAIAYGGRGIHVSCLCPMGVDTPMLHGDGSPAAERASAVVRAAGAVVQPEEVADQVVDAIAAERFFVLPHPEVAEFVRRRADDHERWLAGMRRLQLSVDAGH